MLGSKATPPNSPFPLQSAATHHTIYTSTDGAMDLPKLPRLVASFNEFATRTRMPGKYENMCGDQSVDIPPSKEPLRTKLVAGNLG